jgi:PhzF family phenazine biosynthesis protein
MRWFTPQDELTASSHGSLAAVHALIESGRFVSLPDDKGTILPIQTSKGILTVRCERLPAQRSNSFLVWLDLPRPQLRRRAWAPRLWGELLDVPRDAFELAMPSVQTGEGDVLVPLKSLPPLMEACPDFRELAAFSCQQGVRAWCLATTATLTPSIDVQSRVFSPARGVDEDPVTGHIQGQLAAYLVGRALVPTFGDAAVVTCTQSDSRARAGLVRAVVARRSDGACDVRIAGQCVTVMTGTLQT